MFVATSLNIIENFFKVIQDRKNEIEQDVDGDDHIESSSGMSTLTI
jgi:hypothetical protein